MLRSSLVVAVTLVIVACTSGLDAEAAGGTKPSDGAPGVCCEPRSGGCAYLGGYIESGTCEDTSQCDGMCNQRIVADAHGCKKLAYDWCDFGQRRVTDAGSDSDSAARRDADASTDAASDADGH